MGTAEQLDEAIDFINYSRDELSKGNVVVLEGFQERVKVICGEIANMPVNDMLQYAGKLQELSKLLQHFETDLRQQQALVQKEMVNLNQKQKALKTYETINSSDKKNSDGNS